MSWKEHFDLGDAVYLNGGYHGPFPRVATEAVAEALELKRDPSVIDDSIYFSLPDRIRAAAAPFFGCLPQDLALTTGATSGVALLAEGLDWRPGDHVVIPAGEFPANYLPWQALRPRGVELTVVANDGGISAAAIEAALRPTTRVVAVGLVNFSSGYRADVEAIGALCRQRDIAFVIDAAQGVCSVPVDCRSAGATIVTAAGYKWMLGPYGTGLFYVDPDWVERLPVPVVNWTSVVGAEDFSNLSGLSIDFRPGAVRWDAPETASYLNTMPWAASLEFLGRIGIEAIYGHTLALLDRLVASLPAGFRAGSSLDAAHRSALFRVVGDDPDRTRAAYQRCIEAGISVSMREGGLRVSPGVWNDAGDIDRLVEQLRLS